MQYEIAAASMGKFILVSIVVFVIIIVEGINMLKEDLFEQSGYLTFTIPRSGKSILFSKISLLFLQLTFWTIICFQFGKMFFSKLPLKEISQITSQIDFPFFPSILFIMTAFFNFVLMVHFSITLTKTLLYNKKYSGIISVGIFFLLAYLIEKFYYGPFASQIQHVYIEINNTSDMSMLSAGYTSVFMNVILSVIFFSATAYLLENKINI